MFDKCSSITAKAKGLIFFHCSTLLQPDTCLLAYRSTYSAFFMDLPVSSFVSHSSLLTAKGVDLAAARDGFYSYWKSSVFFTVSTLIAEVLFKQFLIRTAV